MMDNLGLWLVILGVSAAMSLISVGVSALSRWRTVLGFIPQMLGFILAVLLAISARAAGGLGDLVLIIMAAMVMISTVLSAATFSVIVIVRKSKNKTRA